MTRVLSGFWGGILGGLLSGILLCFPLLASAWNAAGHRQIAALAWEVMTEPARQEALALVRAHPDYPRWLARQQGHTKEQRKESAGAASKYGADYGADYDAFLEAAVWADTIRHDARFYSPKESPTPRLPGFPDMARHGDWHYQDKEGGALAHQLPRLARNLAQGSREQRAYALVWILHLVGDLHQPLHSWGRADRGGNGLPVVFAGRPATRLTLHRYWDDLPGASGLRGERLRLSLAEIPRLSAQKQADEAKRTGDTWRWLEDSRALARRSAYPPVKKGVGVISPEFHRQAKAIARQRIALAGYRLGLWLNLLLDGRERGYERSYDRSFERDF